MTASGFFPRTTARAWTLALVAMVVLLGTVTIAAAAAPAVTGVSPSSGPAGTVVTITGTGLAGATAVYFDGDYAEPVSVTATQVTVIAPAHAAGQVDVQVETDGGVSPTVPAGHFVYAATGPIVTGVSPSSGPAGTLVTITGTGFSGALSVSFGDAARAPASVSASQVMVFAPAHVLGLVNVRVTTALGTSPVAAAGRFTYTGATPVVNGVSPGSGTVGTLVTITGTGFTGATSVNFGASPAAPVSVSETQITVIAPSHQVGPVDVFVTTPNGTSPAVIAARFSYLAAGTPVVTSISPSSGVAGMVVVIRGTGFTGATIAAFDTTSAAGSVSSDTLITVAVPAHAAGTVDVRITNAIGTSAVTAASQFTYTASPAPVITSISPASGSSNGGASVSTTGSGFTGATTVTFGGAVAGFSMVSDTQLTAVTPFHIVGTVDVRVSSPLGTSANTAADDYRYTQDFCPEVPLWVNDLAYGSIGGGFYWDPVSGLVWASQRNWHLFRPQPLRVAPLPLWVNALSYGSIGGGFYWDPVSGTVWTAERGWHLYQAQSCIARP